MDRRRRFIELRRQVGLTQAQTAAELGRSIGWVQGLEQGKFGAPRYAILAMERLAIGQGQIQVVGGSEPGPVQVGEARPARTERVSPRPTVSDAPRPPVSAPEPDGSNDPAPAAGLGIGLRRRA